MRCEAILRTDAASYPESIASDPATKKPSAEDAEVAQWKPRPSRAFFPATSALGFGTETFHGALEFWFLRERKREDRVSQPLFPYTDAASGEGLTSNGLAGG